jgi:surface carbohydrate biosynthesis protein
MKLKKNLFLPIEFKYREFNSKILLAFYAIKAGYRVYIGTSDSIFKLIKFKRQKGGIFFYKGGLELNRVIDLKKKCDHFVILDEELGTEKKNYAFIARKRIWPGTEKFIDRYYVIGKYGYETSCDTFPEMRSSIRCTGWPRVDLWKKENEFLFKNQTDLIKKKYGNFILFTSDFGFTSRRMINDKLDAYQKSHWKSLVKDSSRIEKIAEETFKEYGQFLEILRNYDKIKGLPLMIIRPHPAENIDSWFEFSKELKNIKVLYEGEITPWINASSGILHRGCASAIQAHMRGLPVGHFVNENDKVTETPYKISQHLFTLDDIIQFCKTATSYKDRKPITYHEEFKEMIYVKKETLASELIVKDLLKLETNNELNFKISFKNTIINLFICMKLLMINFIKYVFGVKKKLAIVPRSKKVPGGINKHEVEDFLKLLDNNQKFRVKKVLKDCIEID